MVLLASLHGAGAPFSHGAEHTGGGFAVGGGRSERHFEATTAALGYEAVAKKKKEE